MIFFRPHHFLCTLGFRGLGYSEEFVGNYRKISKQLSENENTLITVAKSIDTICSACPNKIDNTSCTSQDIVTKLDAAHAQILDSKIGDQLSWKQAKIKLKELMSIESFLHACKDCKWQSLGICQSSLQELLDS